MPKVEITIEKKKDKKVETGDILVFDGIPYLVIDTRYKSGSYDLLSLVNPSCYWTGGLTSDELQGEANLAELHYKKDEYKIIISEL